MKTTRLTGAHVHSLILPRRKDSNKGDYGRVLIIAGSKGMTGAAVLCAAGALRSGAGLVTVAVPQSVQAVVAAQLHPEAMILGLAETKSGMISPAALADIFRCIDEKQITAVVVGPGIGLYHEMTGLIKDILQNITLPVVLDADAINAFSRLRENHGFAIPALKGTAAQVIVTPHPGEMSRLTGISVDVIQSDRPAVARRFAVENGIVCVLKGYRTVVADGGRILINSTGNPGMATGGAGDVLAGVIGGLIAQVKEPCLFNAAAAGVYVHGLAGDKAANCRGQRGLLAGDIAENLPYVLKEVSSHAAK